MSRIGLIRGSRWIWTFENIRHISYLNAQLEFHFQVHLKCIDAHLKFLDMLQMYFQDITKLWVDQLLPYNFQTYFQPIQILFPITFQCIVSDVKCITVEEKVLQFRYFSHNTVSVEIIFEQKYYNFQTFCSSSAGVCPRSHRKCVFTHTLSVPMLCLHNLLILATPLCLIKYLIHAKRKLSSFTATWITSQIELLIIFTPIWLPTKLVLIVLHTPQLNSLHGRKLMICTLHC